MSDVVRGLHHVQLAIPPRGEDRARAFWGGALGMTELVKPPKLAARGGCWFRSGRLEVHLGVEEPFTPAARAHPGILVDDLDQVVDALARAGHEVRRDDAFPGFDWVRTSTRGATPSVTKPRAARAVDVCARSGRWVCSTARWWAGSRYVPS